MSWKTERTVIVDYVYYYRGVRAGIVVKDQYTKDYRACWQNKHFPEFQNFKTLEEAKKHIEKMAREGVTNE